MGLTPNNPRASSALPMTAPKVNPCNQDETLHLLEAMRGDRLEARWMTAVTLGLRQVETSAFCGVTSTWVMGYSTSEAPDSVSPNGSLRSQARRRSAPCAPTRTSTRRKHPSTPLSGTAHETSVRGRAVARARSSSRQHSGHRSNPQRLPSLPRPGKARGTPAVRLHDFATPSRACCSPKVYRPGR